MLETKEIKAPSLYKKQTPGVASFKNEVEKIYQEMSHANTRKKSATKEIIKLEEERDQSKKILRTETNKAARGELESKIADLESKLQEQEKYRNTDIANLLSEQLSEIDVQALKEKAEQEHNAKVSEIVAYEKKLRKAFNESMDEVRRYARHNDYKEANRLLDAIESTIRSEVGR